MADLNILPLSPEGAVWDLADALSPGTIFAERFEIIELLGQGGMGTVYRASDIAVKRIVALKILRKATSDETLMRFCNEAKLLAVMKHPNIITVYQFGVDQRTAFIVMECLEGKNLRQLIRGKQPIAESQITSILHQLALALVHAHDKGIIHRDIKPSNVVMLESGEVKLMDFGISKLLDPANAQLGLTDPGAILGTPFYTSPEQCDGHVDARSDIYSLGCLAYELIAGVPPFVGETSFEILNQHIAAVPKPLTGCSSVLARTVEKAMQKNPQSRFQTAAEFALALEDGPDSSGKPSRRTLRRWILGLCSVPLILALSIAFQRSFVHSTPQSQAISSQTLNSRLDWAVLHKDLAEQRQLMKAIAASDQSVLRSGGASWIPSLASIAEQQSISGDKETADKACAFAVAILSERGTSIDMGKFLLHKVTYYVKAGWHDDSVLSDAKQSVLCLSTQYLFKKGALQWLGNVYAAQGNTQEAFRCYKAALAVALPENEHADMLNATLAELMAEQLPDDALDEQGQLIAQSARTLQAEMTKSGDVDSSPCIAGLMALGDFAAKRPSLKPMYLDSVIAVLKTGRNLRNWNQRFFCETYIGCLTARLNRHEGERILRNAMRLAKQEKRWACYQSASYTLADANLIESPQERAEVLTDVYEHFVMAYPDNHLTAALAHRAAEACENVGRFDKASELYGKVLTHLSKYVCGHNVKSEKPEPLSLIAAAGRYANKHNERQLAEESLKLFNAMDKQNISADLLASGQKQFSVVRDGLEAYKKTQSELRK
jgi:serine/threonine protein kinase